MTLIDTYKQAASLSSRSLSSLLIEAARLRVSRTKLGLSEYIDFRLYMNDLSWPEKASFGGQRTQAAIEDILVDDYSRFLSLDKITMYALMSGLKIPVPKIKAVYRSMRPSSIPQLQTLVDVSAFFTDPGSFPLYIKRSFGSYGRGNLLITGFDGHNVIFGNGRKESLNDFCSSLDEGRTLGWIFQESLAPHQDIFALTKSNKISGLRIHTFFAKNEVKITKVIFKINAGLRDSDNFEHGASGNMLAAVDVKTGKVIRAISGVGLHQTEIPIHPSTKAEIVGFKIPNWNEVVDLVTDAQKGFPGFICPGWDIALCSEGPKVLEVNAFGDIDLSQHAYRTSFFDEDFIWLLRSRGLDGLMYSPPKNHLRSPINHRMGIRKHHWLW
ncbi:sugar-transfer associated ATP-grasp domain-containing protein [Candidatus Accumulibacter sp. ACC003]|uniref:sugar-transfer associated ATP-grasp domain-containing protein n=1 Tax=Candidatus Accumulibacter sp. ACC003 TaxID=2823334 RepID=UPI0025B82084|nr:sugar-transfer associated ATP-grasp domain-containing protein [Candidatus Accumulibacter sp. ACC003]